MTYSVSILVSIVSKVPVLLFLSLSRYDRTLLTSPNLDDHDEDEPTSEPRLW